MKPFKILLALFLCLFISACSNQKEASNSGNEDRLKQVLDENNYQIVDVRTKEEYEEGHIKNAILIPYDQINDQIALDKEKKILVYCRSGRRSAIAYQTLTNLGFDVMDLGAYDTIDMEKE